MIVAFAGHRPDKCGGYKEPNQIEQWVREQLRTRLKALKPDSAISGMALGVDTWAAEVCTELGIPFTAAVPFRGFDGKWPESSRVRFRDLLAKAAQVVVVCEGEYAPWKMQKRNEWMIDNATHLLAVWNQTKGGTANCIKYATTKLAPENMDWIDPRKFQPTYDF